MTTQAPPLTQVSARLWEDRGRLCLQLGGGSWERWEALRQDFRRTFPRHSQACWRRTQRCWSLPARERARLMEWAEAWGLGIREEGNG